MIVKKQVFLVATAVTMGFLIYGWEKAAAGRIEASEATVENPTNANPPSAATGGTSNKSSEPRIPFALRKDVIGVSFKDGGQVYFLDMSASLHC